MRILTKFLCLAVAASPSAAGPLTCEDPVFRVTASDAAIAARTCESATAARQTLLSCGVVLEESVEISVVNGIAGGDGSCLGLYHCGEGRIEILSPAAMRLARDAYGAFVEISDDAFWDSVLVHELTHAAYDEIECPFPSCVATSEFASYAMQVHSLPPEERARFGESVELRSEPNSGAISAVMYFMAPDRFAKYAWLHFSTQSDPCAYMALIMQGNLYFDRGTR